MPALSPYALKIYTDGSALKNPGGRGGVAGIADFPDSLADDSGPIFEVGYLSTTNNRMELRACLMALDYARRYARWLHSVGISLVIILTDSKYVCENGPRSLFRWQDRKRASETGKPVQNSDPWQAYARLITNAGIHVKVTWIKGKSNAITKEVDQRAKRAARTPLPLVDEGYVPGGVARRKTPGKTPATAFPAAGQTETVRIYNVRPLKTRGVVMNRVKFDWVVGTDHVTVHFAYVLASHPIHRNHYYKVTFNDDPSYPQILAMQECKQPLASAGG